MMVILWSALIAVVASMLILFAAQQTNAPRLVRLMAIGASLVLAFLVITDVLVSSFRVDYRIPGTVLIPVSLAAYYVMVSRLVFKLPLSWLRFGKFALLSLFGWAAFHAVTAMLVSAGVSVYLATFAGAAGNACVNLFVQPGWAFRSVDA